MKSRKSDIELLESYMMGTLGEEHRFALEERIKSDADLNADYQELLLIRQGIRIKALQKSMNILKSVEKAEEAPKVQIVKASRFERFRITDKEKGKGNPQENNMEMPHKDSFEWENSEKEQNNPKENGSKNGTSWMGVTVALLILATILSLTIYFLRQDQPKDLTIALNDDEFYRYILHRTERNSHIESDLQKAEAYNLFTIQEFSKARPALSAMWNEKQDTLSYFYLGIAELQLGNKEVARKIFSSDALQSYPVQELLPLCE
ncbi:MAG TPA: hypothetical protein PKC30_08485 [Saprospiraceae bacterium]|nr:hypothetical protein [Saprospiraceae bacterium]